MIYLDNAATTFPKPVHVRDAVNKSFSYAANPGRAGHGLSIKASEKIFECRSKICDLFDFEFPENVILTSGCTHSLNIIIKGVLNKGDHVVISSLEHNSVLRPLEALKNQGIISYDVADVFEGDDDRTLDSFRSKFRDNTRLVVCTHASNVFGVKTPVSRLCALCHFYDILFCIDAAQTAGIVDIDIKDCCADYICAPGHKGLYGPMGTGFLIINSEVIPKSLIEGGTGSGSSEYTQPQMLPDKFESGTQNLSGLAGLSAGIDFVNMKTPQRIHSYEMDMVRFIYDALSEMNGIVLYTSRPDINNHVPLLSFNLKELYSEEVAQLLNKNNICVRAGLHCSPLAHKTYGTFEIGTLRVCPSVFTTKSESKLFINAIYKIVRSKKIFI